MTEETAAKLKKAASGSVPAWFGSGGLIALIVAQAFGLDPAAITGKGHAQQVASLEKRLDRMDQRVDAEGLRITAANGRIRGVEQSTGILFERTDTAKEDRAEIKGQLNDVIRSLSTVATTAARIEAKLDRGP